MFKKISHMYLMHKLTASITLTGENLEVVPVKSGTRRQGYLLSPQLFNDCSWSAHNVIRWENEIISINIG